MSDREMVAALEQIVASEDSHDGYLTTDEWCELLGLEAQAVRKRIKAAQRAGRCEVRTWRAPDQRGRLCLRTGYRILPE